MVRFPEQDPKESPQIPETSLQQKWRAEHSRELIARRTWKSTQMTLEAVCGRFKTFLVREFGTDYVSALVKEYGDVDVDNAKDTRYTNAIKTLQGPNGMPTINPVPQPADDATVTEMESYNAALIEYNAEVDHRKTYLGIPVPDAETATRILTIIRKMREYEVAHIEASDNAVEHATRSYAAGEFPPAPMLRAIASKAEIWKKGRGVISRPIDWNNYGITSDDPRDWNSKAAGYQPIYTTWYMPHLRAATAKEYGEYRTWSDPNGNNKAGTPPTYSTWTHVFFLFCERNFNLKANGNGFYISPTSNSFVYVGPILLYAAKSYNRTADPLHYWSTQSKYRLNATDYGSKGVHVELCLVESKIGAPTGASMLVASYPAGTTKGQAIAQTRQYYPHVMDVETGNNPQLDSLVATATTPSHIKKASEDFMKQPQSSRDGYRYVAVTRTVLAFPGSELYNQSFPSHYSSTGVAPWSALYATGGEGKLAMLYNKNSPWSVNGHSQIQKQLFGWQQSEYINWQIGTEEYKSRNKQQPNSQGKYDTSPWVWSKHFDRQSLHPEYVKEMVLGVPNKHPDARMITTLDIVLVPEQFERGIFAIEQAMRAKSGDYWVYEGEEAGARFARSPSHYWAKGKHLPKKEWNALSNALVLLTSGHWAAEKKWYRDQGKGRVGPLSGNAVKDCMFGATGIPLSDIWSYFHMYSPLFGNTPEIAPILASAANASGFYDGSSQMTTVMNVLGKYGLSDLSGLKTVYSGAVNDKDDVIRIISNFNESFPGVAELVMPDTENLSDMAPMTRPFHANVTSLSIAPCVNIPKVANGEWGSYIVRRIPIKTTGVSGKRYTFGSLSLNTSMLEFNTNDFSMQMPESSIGGANLPLVVGGLAVAGLLAYAGYGGITSPNDSTKS